ncbi:uncharacterized protein STEHIDRAFT_150902 [Stereum hirsutum FP-91666 SS1]|uniref:F-box domain-containing protein n=1 Tax=Stereum hirsutum (strain FP-91666) TaxID=721885 RepID=R7RWL0_STEHR|nr:uncharacterized protein STEHIDRAFT_150902 [Stereum hirsutum FP-91666 SS1]EIM79699.1 hypothetical protein STEHIDRAFT_150902 [Stereum hirsutum FP-91666 SS1]
MPIQSPRPQTPLSSRVAPPKVISGGSHGPPPQLSSEILLRIFKALGIFDVPIHDTQFLDLVRADDSDLALSMSVTGDGRSAYRLNAFRTLACVCKGWTEPARTAFWSAVDVSQDGMVGLLKAMEDSGSKSKVAAIKHFSISMHKNLNKAQKQPVSADDIRFLLPSILFRLPRRLRSFQVLCSDDNDLGLAVYETIVSAHVSSTAQSPASLWTIDADKVDIRARGHGHPLRLFLRHFTNVKDLTLSAGWRDHRPSVISSPTLSPTLSPRLLPKLDTASATNGSIRAPPFLSAFDGLDLQSLSIILDCSTPTNVTNEPDAMDLDEESYSGHIPSVAQHLALELRNSEACANLRSLHITMDNWHDNISPEDSVRAFSHLLSIGGESRVGVQELTLETDCDKETCPRSEESSQRVKSLCETIFTHPFTSSSSSSTSPYDAPLPPIITPYPNLTHLRLTEFGLSPLSLPLLIHTLDCSPTLQSLDLTTIDDREDEALAVGHCLRLERLMLNLREVRVRFGRVPRGIGEETSESELDGQVEAGGWVGLDLRESWGEVEMVGATRGGINVKIVWPEEA